MTDETEANAVTDASQAAATTGTQQSETLYTDKGRAAHQVTSAESDQDVGADEAVAAAIARAVMAWQANEKRTYDRTEETLQQAVNTAQGHLARVQVMAETGLQNLILRANDQNTSRQTYHDVSVDRLLNINEDSAHAVGLASVIFDAIKTTKGE